MAFTNTLLKLAGKRDFKLDRSIPTGYIVRECITYGLMMVRGYLRRLTGVHVKGRFFVGSKVKIRCPGMLSCGSAVRIREGACIDALSTDGVKLGGGVLIGRNCRLECTGSLASIGKGIEIGERSTFGSDCYFGAAGGIRIGSDVMAGQYVRFHSENHLFGDRDRLIREQGVTHEGVVVGDNCWIGAGVVFLDGVELGEGCVIAANAVVTKSFPANSVIGGVPAKLLKIR